jgi:hypothetical protein
LRYLLALKYSLDPQFVDINVNINGKKSSFSIPDVMNVQIESCKNPVTGEEQETKIQKQQSQKLCTLVRHILTLMIRAKTRSCKHW